MVLRICRAVVVLACLVTQTQAAGIDGTVVIERKLTKRKVTASWGAYERGAAVELHATQGENPLGFERTHAVIYLEGQFPAKPMTAIMEQKNRQFHPDLLVISAGSSVSFPNLDPIFHNVFSLSKPQTFDLGNYAKDQTRRVTFSKPGIIFVNCRLHPNMTAVIVVSPNQWITRADAEGRFTLPDVPPGKYTIVAWHKTAGFFRQAVNVDQKRGATVQFMIPIDENGVALSRR